MEKKFFFYKNSLLLILFFIGFGTLLTSCEDWLNDSYSNRHYSAISLGFVQTNTADMTFVIALDNGSIVTPVQNSVSSFGVRDSERVWVRFDPTDHVAITDSTNSYHSRIYSLREILYKDIKKTTEVAADSAGNDPIIVRDAWISAGNILNIDFSFYSNGSVHYINLLDNSLGDGITSPFILELHHNARGDALSYLVSAIASFNLDKLKVAGHHEVNFMIKYTDYRGNIIEKPKTFRY